MRARIDRLLPGSPEPLGATVLDGGVNFALFSLHAERVNLCILDAKDREILLELSLPEQTHGVWHGFLPDVTEGTLYAYRVFGPQEPTRGHRFDPRELLLDPYARRWDGSFVNGGRPVCVVADVPTLSSSSKQGVRTPNSIIADAVIYEGHVKGLTRLHPKVPEAQRGTYAALSHPAVVQHLSDLGITALELLPLQGFVDEPHLRRLGLSNYWGYNPVGFFVPEPRFAAGVDPIGELQAAIAALHEAGIAVLLDVVYNHAGEGDEHGDTLCFRGIDNASYYRLEHADKARYVNVTGCGNTLDTTNPWVIRLVADSMRYWIETFGIDGFRFDLAPVLGREPVDFDPGAALLDVIAQDPLLRNAVLIAEPWDVGHGGYRLGQFPPAWSEWNDRFRDTVRAFWRGDKDHIHVLRSRLAGSSDIFHERFRSPWTSINYIAAHDGFTLNDLVSFGQKHNHANGEGNRDGHDHNLSWNCGVEGPTARTDIKRLRLQQRRNFVTTLLLARGVPMLLMGDELGRTQHGNNNGYCQDNEVSWVDWSRLDDPDEAEFCNFIGELAAFRREHAVFRGRHVTALQDHLVMLDFNGADADVPVLQGVPVAMFVSSESAGESVGADDALVILMNPTARSASFDLRDTADVGWRRRIDTRFPSMLDEAIDGASLEVAAHSCVVLQAIGTE